MGLFGFKKKKSCKKNTYKKNTYKKNSSNVSFVNDKKLNRKEKEAFFAGLNGMKLSPKAARYKKLYEKGIEISHTEEYQAAEGWLAYLGNHCDVYGRDKYGNLKIFRSIPYDTYKDMQKNEKLREEVLDQFGW